MNSRKSILLIDDDLEYTRLVELWLKKINVELYVSNSSTKAFEVIEVIKPDLILLDYFMPSLNGHQVCAVLKNHPDFCKIPVVFLSASTDPQAVEKALALGAKEYISKLLQREKFIETLQKYL